MEEAQLQETIHFEAEQYIPFDISDVNLDFQVLGENENNPSNMDVLLVAAKKEIVDEYAQLIRIAGLNPRIIDVDAFALQNVYEANYDTENENVALIDVGKCFGEMAYIGGQPRAANVVAETDCILMKISAPLLDRASEAMQLLFFKNFAMTLVQRLSNSNQK